MRGRLALLLCLALAASCQKDSAPDGILKPSQMVDWMITVYLAESRVNAIPIPRDSAYKLFAPYQDSLKHQKGLSDSVLIASYQYYLAHPDEMEKIYDTVIDSLNLREQRFKKDSIRTP